MHYCSYIMLYLHVCLVSYPHEYLRIIKQNTTQNQNTTLKKTKQKPKKKPRKWPWSMLGLKRTNRKAKNRRPSSRATGSDAGLSSSGLRRPSPMRPISRASQHSSSKPSRPSVRASKIRKDVSE